MGDALDQSKALLQPVDLAHPSIDCMLIQDSEERVILRKGIWQLDDICNKEWPRRARSAGNWLVWVRMWDGAVILEGKLTQPVEHPVGRRGSEANRSDLVRPCSNLGKLFFETAARGEHRAIVIDAVNSQLEATIAEVAQDAMIDRIPVCDNVERGAWTAL